MRLKASREAAARYLHFSLDRNGSSRLSKPAAKWFSDPSNEIFLSVVSVWEIAVKYLLGTLRLPAAPIYFVTNQRESHGISALPLTEEEVLYLPKIPKLHRDPFDRMLICQAVVNGLAVLTPDELVSQYPIRTLW
jgi:PIN domain nuclease of toxin-antitoxin system